MNTLTIWDAWHLFRRENDGYFRCWKWEWKQTEVAVAHFHVRSVRQCGSVRALQDKQMLITSQVECVIEGAE